MSFDGKVVLITGAGSGIGAQTASHLAKLGGRLALVDINFEQLNNVAEGIIKAGSHNPLAIVADVTDDPEHIISEAIEHFGKLDVLINNVGIIIRHNLMNMSIGDFDRIMNTNVRSAVILTKCAVPHLERAKGNIVNVSSVVGLRASATHLAYSMSKAAINQFTKCIAVELGPRGIRVNAVNPGLTNTPMIETIPLDERDDILEYMRNAYPLRRIGEPIDISQAIAFLASEKASFVTGALFCVDGGATAANIF